MGMTLHRVEVRDFQSIAAADVDFGLREGGGGITTIVGSSSTGKSALLRALRMLMRNTSSASVRVGQKKTSVTATWDEHTVGIERGPGLSTYTVDSATYAKSGVGVPEGVGKVLMLRTDTPDPHFSFQFDRPYLLGETGSVVSDTIGALTNANVLRAAVREGARRASAAKHLRDVRVEDAKALAAQIKERFTNLPAREEALENARRAVENAAVHQRRAEALAALVEALASAQTGYQRVLESGARYDGVYPLVDEADKHVTAVVEYERLVTSLARTTALLGTNESLRYTNETAAQDYDEEYHVALKEAGLCPTCGAATA